MSFPLIALAGLAAGLMNTIAGGGSFVTFPALVYVGLPSVIANATSTAALFPASFAGAYGYRKDFKPFAGLSMPLLFIVSLAGGVCGALLLLFTSVRTFDVVIPWLLLLATLAFAFARPAGDWLRAHTRIGSGTLMAAQFLLGLYGGYFGGAVGLMMLSVWSVFGLGDMKAMNAAKNLIVGSTNAVAVVLFMVAGAVWWRETLVMAPAAILGAIVGARIGRRLDPKVVRSIVLTVDVLVTLAFFWRVYAV